MEKKFDAVVIGAGSGLTISSTAAGLGLKTAVIEKGPFGGTCLNRGCIPSKMLIHSAEAAENVKSSGKFGIKAKIVKVDWKKIQRRVWSVIDPDAEGIEKGNKKNKNISVFKGEGKFIGEKEIQVGNDMVVGEKIFICAGTRPSIPKIPGLDEIDYLTSDSVLRLKKQPKSIIMIGGGYISAELAHFLSSLGTKVSILNRGDVLVKREDKEVSENFTRIASKKYKVYSNTDILRVGKKGNLKEVELKQKGKKRKIKAEEILVATGRTPNTDILDVSKTGVRVNKRGFIEVDNYMETNVKSIWAIGDIAGKYLFKHSANLEAEYCAHNAFYPDKKMKVDYSAMPHAIFSSPQIAGVGKTEQELQEYGAKYKVGKYKYKNTGMGMAISDEEGFVKFLIGEDGKKILGCHIMGSDASTLIHEVLVAMKNRLGVIGIRKAVHIHPALSEVVQRALWKVE